MSICDSLNNNSGQTQDHQKSFTFPTTYDFYRSNKTSSNFFINAVFVLRMSINWEFYDSHINGISWGRNFWEIWNLWKKVFVNWAYKTITINENNISLGLFKIWKMYIMHLLTIFLNFTFYGFGNLRNRRIRAY